MFGKLTNRFLILEDFDDKATIEDLDRFLLKKFGVTVEDCTPWVTWLEDVARHVIEIPEMPPGKMLGRPDDFPWEPPDGDEGDE